jgi:hypothetical protein
MLIEIDSSVVDDALGKSKTASISRERLENLLLAHHECKHVVCIEKDAAARLESLQGVWSSRAIGSLRNIRGRYNEIRALRNRLKWIVRIGVGPAYAMHSVETDGKVCIHVSAHQWGDLAQLSSGVTLLAENLFDTAFYRIIGEAFIAENGWKWSLCFDEKLGGGDTTAVVLQQLATEEKPTLTIVDSDKKHPQDVVGKTARRAMSVRCNSLQVLHVLHVRDIENLIPLQIYELAFDQRSKLEAALRSFKSAESLNCKYPWRDHTDIKEGITLFDIASMTSQDERSFWREVAKDLNRDQCANPPDIAGCGHDKKDRHCFVIPAFGDDALKMVVAWMQKQDRKRIAKLIGFTNSYSLAQLGEKIIAWGIAEQRGMRA